MALVPLIADVVHELDKVAVAIEEVGRFVDRLMVHAVEGQHQCCQLVGIFVRFNEQSQLISQRFSQSRFGLIQSFDKGIGQLANAPKDGLETHVAGNRRPILGVASLSRLLVLKTPQTTLLANYALGFCRTLLTVVGL